LGQKQPLNNLEILSSEWLVLGKADTRHSDYRRMPVAAFGQKQPLADSFVRGR
jgi:hypothetical protein